ncbi:MAG: exopolysaccharide biosynthesis polyprenyl glycosylphosphotransferase [Chitinophagales bacterium]|nr:exopolysaccharide biosynthesis polyprenyl glycosylphosphotransferase [Chitinophagales bacterium]
MQQKREYNNYYLTIDFISALLAWLLFFTTRKFLIEQEVISTLIYKDIKLLFGIVLIPCFWLLLYYCSNDYYHVLRKNISVILFKTLFQSIVGCFILFFILMLNDKIHSYKDYYILYFIYLGIHYSITLIFRIVLFKYFHYLIKQKKIQLHALVIGDAIACDNLIASEQQQTALYAFKKLILDDNKVINTIDIQNNDSIFFAIPINAINDVNRTIIDALVHNVDVYLRADDINFLTGKFKTDNVLGSDMIAIDSQYLKPYQAMSKRLFDIVISLLSLPFLLFIIFPIISFLIKKDSKGNIFYTQERIGKNGKPFRILKFRTMIENAEATTPMLTANNDDRITTIGKFLRKFRIDELPQLINVFIGDMSLVGPRPERQFYINQIKDQMPHYSLLQKIKPGITSLGMVKFGYANTIASMIQRAKYDLIYLDNISLLLDIKIIFYTINTVIKGKGK